LTPESFPRIMVRRWALANSRRSELIDVKFVRSSVFHYTLLLLAVAFGGFPVVGLRLSWGRVPGASWLRGLLVASALLGGFALSRLERTIPAMQPPSRSDETPVPPTSLIPTV
jgi:hypothetical protein